MSKVLNEIREAVKKVHEADALVSKINLKTAELDQQQIINVEVLETRRKALIAELSLEDNEADRQALATVVKEIEVAQKSNQELLELRSGLVSKREAAFAAREAAFARYQDVFYPYLAAQAVELNKTYFAAASTLLSSFKRISAIGALCKDHAVGFAFGEETPKISIPLFNLEPTRSIRTADATWDDVNLVRLGGTNVLAVEQDLVLSELLELGLTL